MIGVIITAVYAYVLTTVILKSAMHFTTITTTKKNKKKDWTFLLWQQTQLKQIQIERGRFMQQSKTKIPAKINVLWLLAMTISMVVSLYEYPTFATSGFSLVFSCY